LYESVMNEHLLK